MSGKVCAGVFALVCSLSALAGAAVASDETAIAPAPGSGGQATDDAQPADDVQAQAAERERRIAARTERARREALFNQLDRDGDGYLSEAELRGGELLESSVSAPGALDRDNDGRISRTEFAAIELEAER